VAPSLECKLSVDVGDRQTHGYDIVSSPRKASSHYIGRYLIKWVVELQSINQSINHSVSHSVNQFHLARMLFKKLTVVCQGSETYVFPCQRWLARDEDDGAIERELIADKVLEELVRRDGSVKKKELRRQSTLSCDYIF